MLKENQIKLTEEIIETVYNLHTHKLAFGGLTARNENTFDLLLWWLAQPSINFLFAYHQQFHNN